MGNLNLNTTEGSSKRDQPKESLHHTAVEEEKQMGLTDIKEAYWVSWETQRHFKKTSVLQEYSRKKIYFISNTASVLVSST